MLSYDNVKGGVLGLVIADALGVPVEFSTREQRKKDPVIDMRGHGTYNQPAGTWSDDSSMTLATLYALSSGGLSTGMIMDNFANWYNKAEFTPFNDVFDIGFTTKSAILNYLMGEEPENCGLEDEIYNGNGSLMRMLPMIYYILQTAGADITDKSVDLIYRVSSLTHANIVSKVSCVYYVYIGINIIINGPQEGLQKAITDGIQVVEDYYNKRAQDHKCILEYMKGTSLQDSLSLYEKDIKSTGFVVDSLEASLWCLYNTKSYKEAVLKAINLGGDTDTIGAITGSLAGIYYSTGDGGTGIPKEWKNSIVKLDYIYKLINRFYTQYK